MNRNTLHKCKHCGNDFIATKGKRWECSLACRFFGKVNKDGPIPTHCPELGACWIWTGSTAWDGYGRIRIGETLERAHRLSFFLANGEWPECACHHCDNRACVNPSHIFHGSNTDNVRDREHKGRGGWEKRRGALNGRAKLTDGDILKIRAAARIGTAHAVLAATFGVSKSQVTNLVKGRTWRHLPV